MHQIDSGVNFNVSLPVRLQNLTHALHFYKKTYEKVKKIISQQPFAHLKQKGPKTVDI